jgi:hypothetical protein
MADGVKIEKPFKVVRVDSESGPAESLKPFGDRVERPADIPHGEMDRGTFIC